jgi:hypothetical protein
MPVCLQCTLISCFLDFQVVAGDMSSRSLTAAGLHCATKGITCCRRLAPCEGSACDVYMATNSWCRGGTGAVQRAAQVDWIGLDWIELEGGCRRRDVLVDMRLAEKRSGGETIYASRYPCCGLLQPLPRSGRSIRIPVSLDRRRGVIVFHSHICLLCSPLDS